MRELKRRCTRKGRLVLGLLLGAAIAVGCSSPESRPPEPGKETIEATHPAPEVNVVLFLIDTLRFDRLGAYGYAGAKSPAIDALARSGIVFEQAYAPGPWTLPSVASMHTSTFMCEHGVLVDQQRIPSSMDPLAVRMKRTGYATASFYTNPYAGPITGLDRGFDREQLMQDGTEADDLRPWLDSLGQAPFFLYVHNVEPHNPYDCRDAELKQFAMPIDPPMRTAAKNGYDYYRHLTRVDFREGRDPGETDNTVLQNASLAFLDELRAPVSVMYDAQVALADARVGGLIETLKDEGVWDNTLFLLVADHGEEFGEHGGWLHDQSVYEELVHVPMIVRLPGGAGAGRRIDDVVSLVDVLPTILGWIDRQPLIGEARGVDLSPLLRGEALDDPAATRLRVPSMRTNRKKYYRPWKELRGDQNVVVRDGRWKGIWNTEVDSFELFDLKADPLERNNLSAQQTERTATMKDFAARWLAECVESSPAGVDGGGEVAPLDEETKARLRSLGYI